MSKSCIVHVDELSWDVVVIGAGPAGCLAARQIALAGKSVLLVEKSSFPRFKVCGGCVSAHAVASFRSVGLGEVLDSLGGEPLHVAEFVRRGKRMAAELPLGYSISREALDDALLLAAKQAGVAVALNTTVTVLPESEDQYRTVGLASAGSTQIVKARIVLACDGLGHPSLAQLGDLGSSPTRASRIGIGTVIDHPTLFAEMARHRILMAISPYGYVGMSRGEAGRVIMAAAFDRRALATAGKPENAVLDTLRSAGVPIFPGMLGANWRGTKPLTRCAERVSLRRLFLVGDAAGYVEPFTGEGIAWAAAGALAVVPLALQGCEDWSDGLSTEWTIYHRRVVRTRAKTCQMLAWLLKHPWAFAPSFALLSTFPRIGNVIAKRINQPSLVHQHQRAN